MLGRLRRFLAVVASMAFALPAASCAAEKPAYVEREVVTLSFAGGSDKDELNQSYRDIVDLLRKRAVQEARDPGYPPQIGSYAIFPADPARGMQFFIGAVTPRKGVFYVMPYGLYASLDDYRNDRVYWRKGKIDVCRMEVRWDRLPGGPFAPGLGWAGMHMSEAGCQPPPADQLAMLDEWKNREAKPDYVIEGRASDGKAHVALIREAPPKAWAYRPFDAVAASRKLLETGDSVTWAIPLIDDARTTSVVATRRGRLLAYFSDKFYAGDLHNLMCVAEGLSWAEIVAGPQASGVEVTRRLCRDLMTQSQTRRNEELRRSYDKAPSTIQSIPQTLEN